MKFMTAYVDIKAETAALKRGIARARRMATTGAKAIQGIFAKAGKLAIGGGAVAAGIGVVTFKLAKVAATAEEVRNKFDTVFRHLSDSVAAWAVKFSRNVGRSRKEVKAWLAELEDTFVPLGMARKQAAGMSKDLVKLAVDVASFNNATDQNVIRDFTSALVGNHETVRKYGILISQSAMETEALAMGINKAYKELTNLEKVQIRYNIIQNSTTDAQGDAIRTADSFINQLKRMKANWDNLKVTVGKAFLPKWNAAITKLNEYLSENEKKFGRWAAKAVEAATKVSKAIKDWLDVTSWREKFADVKSIMMDLMKLMTGLAIDVGSAVGKAIWKGIKNAIFNPAERDIVKRYEEMGGQFREQRVSDLGQMPTMTDNGRTFVEMRGREGATDADLWAKAQKEVMQDRQKQEKAILSPTLSRMEARLESFMAPLKEAAEKNAAKAAAQKQDREEEISWGVSVLTGKMLESLEGEFKQLAESHLKYSYQGVAGFLGSDALKNAKPSDYQSMYPKMKLTKDLKDFAREVTEMIKTPAQKFKELAEVLETLKLAGELTAEQFKKAKDEYKEQILGDKGKGQMKGSALVVRPDLVDVAGLEGGDAELRELVEQTRHLRNIERKTEVIK